MTILECFDNPALYTFYMAGIVVGTVKSSNEKGLKMSSKSLISLMASPTGRQTKFQKVILLITLDF
ncbi:MAG: hypothetical protein CL941_08390 [Desulfobacter sp.]|nr:hypothetical protein [Desulfobacter sp.]